MEFTALLSTLPALPDEVQENVPIALDQFWWRVRMESDVALRRLVEAVLLMRGAINIVMALEGKEASYFASLSRAEVRGPEFYPQFAETVPTEGGPSAAVADQLWENYFRYALDTAATYGSPLLAAALRWEIGLRNALVTRRASTLDVDAKEHLVLDDQGLSIEDYDPLLEKIDLARAAPPDIERALGQLRLEKLDELSPWASTGREAIVSYAIKLLVLKHASVFVTKESSE